MKRDPNKYPKSWNRKRVESVIAHYEAQTEQDAVAEADAAEENSRMILLRVPVELRAEVEHLIAKRQRKQPAASPPSRRRKSA